MYFLIFFKVYQPLSGWFSTCVTRVSSVFPYVWLTWEIFIVDPILILTNICLYRIGFPWFVRHQLFNLQPPSQQNCQATESLEAGSLHFSGSRGKIWQFGGGGIGLVDVGVWVNRQIIMFRLCVWVCVGLGWVYHLPFWELTYPLKSQFWRWFSFSQGGIC